MHAWKLNRNRANLETEVVYSSGSYTFHSRWTDRYPGKAYIYIYTSRLYRRESWNCSIKQPLNSLQISPATRVYPVIAVSRLAAFPRNFRLSRYESFCRKSIEIALKMVGRGWKARSRWKQSIVREKVERGIKRSSSRGWWNFILCTRRVYARLFDYRNQRTKSHVRLIIVIYRNNSSAR